MATVLISVLCVVIYYWQDQNDTWATDQAYEICEQGYSNYERLVIKKAMGAASADECADMLFYIHYASDRNSEIQSLIDGAEPLPGLSKSDSDVLAGQTIKSIYRQFKATVPDSLSAKLWYEPESWNAWRMFTSNFVHHHHRDTIVCPCYGVGTYRSGTFDAYGDTGVVDVRQHARHTEPDKYAVLEQGNLRRATTEASSRLTGFVDCQHIEVGKECYLAAVTDVEPTRFVWIALNGVPYYLPAVVDGDAGPIPGAGTGRIVIFKYTVLPHERAAACVADDLAKII